MRHLPLAILALSSFTPNALADDCSCDAAGAPETILTTESSSGRELRLRFAADPVTTQTDVAYVCHEPAGTVRLARLWMPAHGHGSAPTRLARVSGDCTRVERVRFSMVGTWEVQVSYDDGDTGSFSLDVRQP
jgi:hypothetical protein